MDYIKIIDSLMYIDDLDSLELHKKGSYEIAETELIKSVLKPSDMAYDIGANIGYFTLLMAKRCAHVFAFEPERYNFDLLCKNIELNKLRNVVTYNCAVTEHGNLGKLYLCDSNAGMHRVYPSKWCKAEAIDVESIKLDDQFGTVDFIKMDIEGSEYGALMGMQNILKKQHPKIMMEFHSPSIRESGIDPAMIYDNLKELGYRIDLIPDRKDIDCRELVEITTWNVARNIFCY